MHNPAISAHHQPGASVLVEWDRLGLLPATVLHIEGALDRPYRVSVVATGACSGRLWSGLAPECVIAAEVAGDAP